MSGLLLEDGLRLLSLRERKKERDLSEIKRARWFASTLADDFGEGLREVDSEIRTLTIAYQPHTAGDFGGQRTRAKTKKGNVIARSHDAAHRDDAAISYIRFSAATGENLNTISFISAFKSW